MLLLLLLLLLLFYLATLLLWWFPLSRSISGNKCLFYTVLSDHSRSSFCELRLETEARKWRQKYLTNTTSCLAFLLGHSLMLCSLPQPWSRLIQTLTLLPLRRRLPRVYAFWPGWLYLLFSKTLRPAERSVRCSRDTPCRSPMGWLQAPRMGWWGMGLPSISTDSQ